MQHAPGDQYHRGSKKIVVCLLGAGLTLLIDGRHAC